MKSRSFFAVVAAVVLSNVADAAHPWAAEVVSYTAGAGVGEGYDNPFAALGEPTRFTGQSLGFPGAVTPFNPAFEPSELVTIGRAGQLTVRFAQAVWDDPGNPYGIDLLVFGNSGFIDLDYPNGRAGPLFDGGEGGLIEVSQDGFDWRPIPGVAADGLFPTLGYLDLVGPYSEQPGSIFSNFLLPVDPAFDPVGRTFAEIVAGYNGSGGGAGVDIGVTGLAWIQYVRVSNPADGRGTPEIDAFAAVPAPGAGLALLVLAARRGRRAR